MVGAGGDHTLMIARKGAELYGLGWNQFGQLGVPAAEVQSEATSCGLGKLVSARGGFGHSIALDYAGRVYACGSNARLQLGVRGERRREEFAVVEGLPPARAISAGSYHSLVASRRGGLWAFGHGSGGKLGLGSEEDAALTRIPFFDSMTVVQMASGGTHSLVLSREGAVYGFGSGRRGQLGPSVQKKAFSPVQLTCIPERASNIVCGGYHSTVRLASGRLVGFGRNSRGQLGFSNPEDKDTEHPTAIPMPKEDEYVYSEEEVSAPE
jgi:alpha-tubulin suppressor-like RCC1 family protein